MTSVYKLISKTIIFVEGARRPAVEYSSIDGYRERALLRWPAVVNSDRKFPAR